MEHKQTVTEVKESRLSVKQKVLFGMGDYLNTITYGMISAFLMAFLTDTLLIPMAAVTAIMSLSKLWDAINDPVIGVIIDKSRSPKGVYRPWLIRMMVPFALSNILLWLPIGHWSTSAKITVVSIVYCLYMVFFTAYHIAYGSLGGAMTQNTDDRGSLYGYRLGTSQLLFWLMTVLWLPLINLLMSGGMAQDKAYFTAAIIFTVPGLLFAVLLYRNSREVVEPQKSTKLPAKDLWHFVIQNGPLPLFRGRRLERREFSKTRLHGDDGLRGKRRGQMRDHQRPVENGQKLLAGRHVHRDHLPEEGRALHRHQRRSRQRTGRERPNAAKEFI